MENRLKQRRVSFSDPPSQKEEGFLRPIFQDEGIIRDEEHGTAVAAGAFAIYSLEQAELLNLQKMKEGPLSSRTQTMRKEEESMYRRPSYGGSSKKKSFREDGEGAFPVRLSSTVQSPRPLSPVTGYQMQKGSPTPIQQNNVNSKVESWKKAKMEKIQKRYEKIKFEILFWEREKKMQAILHMDRKKSKLEQKREMGIQHYQNKIARINRIAQGARAQLEDKRRKEESKVREQADKIRKTGRVPVKCFCFKLLMGRNKDARRYNDGSKLLSLH